MSRYLSKCLFFLSCIKYCPLFVYRQLGRRNRKQITDLLETESSLSFDQHSKWFSIAKHDLTWDQKISLRRSLMSKLREIRPRTSVKIDDIVTSYYDQCLERYLFERINRSIPNENTCWFKFAQNNKCIGWTNPDSKFDLEAKGQFLNRLGQLKAYFKDDKLVDFLERDQQGYVFLCSDRIYKQDDKTLAIYKDIRKNGFSNFISSCSPIILGYSTKTDRYNVITGRHRIAVLRYLRTQGILRESLKLKCHVIRYPFESLVYTRPFTESCKRCDWGGIYDPGSGTHQDFYVREGVAVMRGRRRKKGGKQKWDRIEPVFRDMVQNKTVLDVGAYRGLFCLKALEYGARKSTALEISPELAEVISLIKTSYCHDDLALIQGDFYNKVDYSALVEEKYDSVFLFGIIHHLLRLGIQKGVLHSFDELMARIAEIAIYGVVIEFAMPKETSIMLPELTPYRKAFSQEAFKGALQKFFPNYTNLGRVKYSSGNKFGRFMYCGLK